MACGKCGPTAFVVKGAGAGIEMIAMKISRISIVGGGIGGLSAALALQHFGYRVSVFEQSRELREIGAGVIISPNAMHALNYLGVGERVAKEAGPPRRI